MKIASDIWRYLCCAIVPVLSLALFGCSPSEGDPVSEYVFNTSSAIYQVVDVPETEVEQEGWRFYESKGGYRILLPDTAESRDFGFLLRDFNGCNLTVHHEAFMSKTPLDVFLSDLDTNDPAGDVIEASGLVDQNFGDGELEGALDSISQLNSRDRLARTFEVLADPNSIGFEDRFEAFFLLVANNETVELGETLWRFRADAKEAFVGKSLSNSDAENSYYYAWVLDQGGQSRLFISLVVPADRYRAEEVQVLIQTIVSSVRFSDGD